MEQDSIEIAGRALPVWPEGQRLMSRDGQGTIFRTQFEDTAAYHATLIEYVLARAAEPETAAQYGRSMGGTKIYHLEGWGLPEARLVNARAMAMARQALGIPGAAIDIGWGNVYRRGDYIVPHSHTRAAASLVYCLDEGEADPEDDNAGRFSFVDPRYPACCQIEPGRMTNPLSPEMRAGTLLLFPGELVHFVNPYGGERPRITLSWNLNPEPLEGSPLEPFLGAGG